MIPSQPLQAMCWRFLLARSHGKASQQRTDMREPQLSGRLFASLAVVILAAGCAASVTPTPTSTPGPTAAAAASPTQGPTLGPTPTLQAGLTGPLGVGRQIHTATRLADGRVLVAGGYDVNNLPLASAELYDPTTNTFSPTGSMSAARGLHSATLLSDGRVLIAGGGQASWTAGTPTFLATAELYDPKTGTFSATGSMTTPREDHTATLLSDGRVLIVGGNDDVDHAGASAELYDPKAGTFSSTGSMTTARGFPTATLLADGRVLIVGGNAGTWSYDGPFLATAEIYDPKTGTFSPTGSMATPRAWHTATLLSDGRVLVAGGEHARTDLATAEIYNPKTGRFSPTGPMTVGRVYHAAALLSDGRVVVEGGGSDYSGNRFLASAELYDPKTGIWTATGSMADQRNFLTATLLTNGLVLVAGGFGAAEPLASAELYNPKTGRFTAAGSRVAVVRCAETPSATPTVTVQWTEPVVGPEPTIKAGQAVAFVTTGLSPTVTEWINGTPAASPCIDKAIGSKTGNGMSVVVTFYQPGDYNITCRKTPQDMHTVVHVR
jgi:plastocyanin